MTTATAPHPPADSATLLGHPKGLFVLFMTEMWERMSYYGMRSLLVLYMVNHLFVRPDAGAEVLGFNALKHALESAFGVMTPQALSSQVYGLYTGFVYFTPFLGGLLADKLLGRHRAVVVGGVLMAIGHFLMAVETLFFPALMFLILGNGCFKPNISTQVGGLYAPGDPRRDRAFSIFYVGINLGAFIAPLVCGTLGQVVGWHYGFASAGVGMLIGLGFYLLNRDKLPVEPVPVSKPGAPAMGVAAFIVGVPLGITALLWLITLPPAVPITLAVLVIASGVLWMARLPKDERPRVMALVAACLVISAFWAVCAGAGARCHVGSNNRQKAVSRRKPAVVQQVGQVVARDQHIHHHWPESAPPDDPAMSQQCPQCKGLTWRYTPVCMHCRLDLQGWRKRRRWRAFWRWPIEQMMRLAK